MARGAHRKTAHVASDELGFAWKVAGIIVITRPYFFVGDDPKRSIVEGMRRAVCLSARAEVCFPVAPPALLCAAAFLYSNYRSTFGKNKKNLVSGVGRAVS